MATSTSTVNHPKLTDFTPLDPAIVAALGKTAPRRGGRTTGKRTILHDESHFTITAYDDGEHYASFRPDRVSPAHIRTTIANLGLESIDDIDASHNTGWLFLTSPGE